MTAVVPMFICLLGDSCESEIDNDIHDEQNTKTVQALKSMVVTVVFLVTERVMLAMERLMKGSRGIVSRTLTGTLET